MALLAQDQALRLFRVMLASRHIDLREQSLMRQGQGWFHLATMGHEGAAGLACHLRPGDYLFPYYRDRATVLWRGYSVRDIAREYYGKRSSSSGGRQLPCHYSNPELKIWSHPSPSGVHFLPACGAAWGLKLAGDTEHLVLMSLGEAAARQGDFFEALCVARERRLPIVFVVHDNGLGISTPTRDNNALALKVLEDASWLRLSGADPVELHARGAEIFERVRGGAGPVFVWCQFERLSGHSSADDQRQYRSKELLESLQEHDPVAHMRRWLTARGWAGEQELVDLENEIREQVRADYEAVEQEESPRPDENLLHVLGPAPKPRTPPIEIGEPFTIASAVTETLRAALRSDPRVLLYGEDIEDPKGGVFKITQSLSTQFPGRVVNSPLAESTIVGLACGLASQGRRPVFELQFIDFAPTCWNQLVHNLATLRWRSFGRWSAPCVIYAPYGAYLPGGAIWHSQANEGALAHYPGLRIAIPSTPTDAAGCFWTALQGEDPTVILLPKHLLRKPYARRAFEPVPNGKARVARAGEDVTLVAWGNGMELAQEAAEELADAIDVEVVDLRSIVPWDRETVLASVAKTRRLVVVQEDTENCSVGQMILAVAMQEADIWHDLAAPPVLLSKANVLVGFHPHIEFTSLPSRADVVAALKKVTSRSRSRAAPRLAAEHRAAIEPRSAAEQRVEQRPEQRVEQRPDHHVEREERVAGEQRVGSDHAAPPAPHRPPKPADVTARVLGVKVPHLGEGVYSGHILHLLKQVGDAVRRDEAICEIESDKATMFIESSHDGVLSEWITAAGQRVEVGDLIANIRAPAQVAAFSTTAVVSPHAPHAPRPAQTSCPGVEVERREAAAPRWAGGERAGAERAGPDRGLADNGASEPHGAMAGNGDAHEIQRAEALDPPPRRESLASDPPADEFPPRPHVLERSSNKVALTRAVYVPTASITLNVSWQAIKAGCQSRSPQGQSCSPTALIGWQLVQACKSEAGRRFLANFESSAADVKKLDFDLGVAVALPEDELNTAVIRRPAHVGWEEFVDNYAAAVESARSGRVQDRRRVAIQLSTLGGQGIESAIPLVVPPSMATLFVGAAHYSFQEIDGEPRPVKVASFVLSFDHRLVNGIGAGGFLNKLKQLIEAKP